MSGKPKVLVIGMDEKNLSVIRECLSECDVATMDMEEGQDTLSIPDKVKPDLMILNGQSEKQGTLALCKGLKTNPVTADIPLVVAVDRFQATQVQYVLEEGVEKCMVKPLNVSYVKSSLRGMLENADEG